MLKCAGVRDALHASLRVNRSSDAYGGNGEGGRGSSLTEGLSSDEEARVQSSGDGGPTTLRVPPLSGPASAAPISEMSISVHAQLMAQPIMQGMSQHMASGVAKGQALLARAVGHRMAREGAVAPMVVALLLLIALLIVVALLTLALLNITLPLHYAYRQAPDGTRPSCLRCHPMKWGLEWLIEWCMREGRGRERGAKWTKIDTFSGPVCPDDANADDSYSGHEHGRSHAACHSASVATGHAADHAASHALVHHTTAEGRGVTGDGEGVGEGDGEARVGHKTAAPPLVARSKPALVRVQIPKHPTLKNKPRLPSAAMAAMVATGPVQMAPRAVPVVGASTVIGRPGTTGTDPSPRGSELHGELSLDQASEDKAELLASEEARADETEI